MARGFLRVPRSRARLARLLVSLARRSRWRARSPPSVARPSDLFARLRACRPRSSRPERTSPRREARCSLCRGRISPCRLRTCRSRPREASSTPRSSSRPAGSPARVARSSGFERSVVSVYLRLFMCGPRPRFPDGHRAACERKGVLQSGARRELVRARGQMGRLRRLAWDPAAYCSGPPSSSFPATAASRFESTPSCATITVQGGDRAGVS